MRLLLPLLLWGCAIDDLESDFTPSFLGKNPCADPPAPSAVSCDQDTHGGGWLLVAKVFREPTGTATRPEPRDFWRDGVDASSMGSPAIPPRQAPDSGIAALGIGNVPLLDASLLRIELVHADGFHTQEWFKEIEDFDEVETWFGPADGQEPAAGCLDPELTTGCIDGKIFVEPNSLLSFEGLRIPGATSNFGIHMFLDGTTGVDYNGVCSDTIGDGPGATDWPGSPNNHHWGHGMRIWIR